MDALIFCIKNIVSPCMTKKIKLAKSYLPATLARCSRLQAAFYALFAALLFPALSFGASGVPSGKGQSIGTLSENLLGVVFSVRKILSVICIMAGTSLILGSFIQYKKHKQNPIETRFSTVFFTFALGCCLIVLAFVPMQTENM